MLNFIKKPISVIFIIVILGIAAGGYFYFGREKKSEFDAVIAKRSDLIQEVNVTGRVKPAESVELAFEKGGKVSQVYINVSDKVIDGQTLVELDNAELKAQLAQAVANAVSAEAGLKQYRAALDTQNAKLDELKKGARPEEIRLAETKVVNAEKALADAEINLANANSKADVDLANLYDDVPGILNDAFAKSDDALHKQIDELFSNDDSDYPELTFTVTDAQTEIDAELQRSHTGQALQSLRAQIKDLPTNQIGLDAALIDAENHLAAIRDFLARLLDAVNSAVGISQTSITAHKTNINTGRTNVIAAIANINDQKQAIAVQKIINQQNIAASQAKVNDAESSVSSAEAELSLKQAGSTMEQIAAQEAQVKQAEANVAVAQAQITQARANVQNYQAQIVKTIIYAPISGTVVKQDAKVGEIVSANTALVFLISISQFEIEANVPEADIAKVNLGNIARVTLDAYGNDVSFDVKVVAIDPAETIVDGVATYKVTFQFADKDERIKSGMTANIDISTEKRKNVIVLPQRAVITNNGDKIVRILKGKTPLEVKVKIGLRGSDGNIEIIEGVNEGDKVIIYANY